MARRCLPSIEYDPAGQPSLFDQWEAGGVAAMPAPLAVRDSRYRRLVVDTLRRYVRRGSRLVSIGAGNGFAEAELAAAGWEVLATDPSESALRHCAAKGLATYRFALLDGTGPRDFDAIYCDGVLGHLWAPGDGCRSAWAALSTLGRAGAVCLASNDLADGPEVDFSVRSSAGAAFYRPPARCFARDALATGRWSIECNLEYRYERARENRRREIVVARLLVNEGIEAEDGAELHRGQGRALDEAAE